MNDKNKLTVQMNTSENILGWLYIPFYLVVLGELLIRFSNYMGIDISSAEGEVRLNGAFFVINFVLCLLIFNRFLRLNFAQIGKRFWGFVQAMILGFVMYMVGNYLLQILLDFLMPELANPNNDHILEMAETNRMVIVLGTVFLAPLTEEILFRGVIFRTIHNKNRILGYVVATVAFSALHVVSYVGQTSWRVLAFSFLQYIPASVALAWTYEKSDSLAAPLAMHCILNAVSLHLIQR